VAAGAKPGLRDRVVGRQQQEEVLALRLEQVCLDSTATQSIPTVPAP
jgi:hypothetical protein